MYGEQNVALMSKRTLKQVHDLGIAVIGLGVGEQHAHAYASDSQCELRWLFDLSQEKAAEVRVRVAQSGGAGEIASSYDAILSDPKTDVISIATYDDLHFSEVRKALAVGKHVFVEKPLCRTFDELQDIGKAWRDGGRPHLASNLVLRAAPLYGWLIEQVKSGALGEIYAIDAEYFYGRLPKITEGWRKDVKNYSVMEGGGIHMIDLMVALAGARPQSVCTVGNNVATRGTAFGYDDFQAATFKFPSGLIGRAAANFACVHRHHHILRVFGTKATFIYDDAGARLHTTREEDARAQAIHHAPLPNGKGALIPNFIKAIVQGDDPAPAVQREFDLVSVCAHSDLSHAQGREINIRYVEA